MTKFYPRHSAGSHILVIDWETSGSTFSSYEETFKEYQGVSFGAVIASSETFEPIRTLYREIKFDGSKYKWSAEAEAIHGLTREHLETNGVSVEEAAADLSEFIMETFGTGKVMILGHNTKFDIEATKQLLAPFGVMPELHHVVLDTAIMGFVSIGEYRSDKVFEFFTGAERAAHNSLEDALICLETVKNMRALMAAALGQD